MAAVFHLKKNSDSVFSSAFHRISSNPGKIFVQVGEPWSPEEVGKESVAGLYARYEALTQPDRIGVVK